MNGTRYLLDSNILVWLDLGNPRLVPSFLSILEEAEEIFLSAATAWELSLKIANGKLQIDSSFDSLLKVFHLKELPVCIRHGDHAARLPLIHRDPFDRLLVAQAFVEGLVLVTSDKKLAEYGVPVLLA
ncbi:MAG: type II toxin-antitoxin system VapC family toxin [Terracidiphilus sp.]|jgi:PIN domain nuclease of toxin-antitoxin system